MTIIRADRTECGVSNTNIRYIQTKRGSVLLERGAASVHNLLLTFWFVRNIRNSLPNDVTWYHKGKKTSRSPLRKSKILHNSRHLKMCNCPHRFILWRVSPSLGWVAACSEWYCLHFLLENITICFKIDHDSHCSFSPYLIRHSSNNRDTLNYLHYYQCLYIKHK
jgi:hypothetical protein